MDDERLEEGRRVEFAGLVRDVGLNGRRGICMGRAPDGERWLIALPGGRRVNVKMSNIKPAGDLDTEIVQREDTSAVPLRGPEDPPSRAMIEAHNLTHLPAAPWCEICVQARGKSDSHTQVKYDSEIACVQMDFQFISGVAVWCPEAQAKATVLTMVDMDSGYVGVLMVSGKSPENFTVRSSSSFVEKLRAEKTRLRYDNEPAMRLLAEKIAAFRHPRTTILEPINRAEHQSVGGVERAHQSIQAATRALRLDIRTRTGEDVVPGHALFQWMLRHAAWSHNRFQPQSHRGGTPWEIRTGTCYKSPLLPFMEACMIRVPIDLPGLRRKLDVQWMKGIWVGRLDESDGHVVLTPHGTVTGRSVRRLAGDLRVQRDLVGKIKSRVQDPALSKAELLRVLPASVPIRLSGETDTDQLAEEQDRAAQNEQMEGIVDERARAEITRPLRSIEDDNDVEVKRQRLGEPLATIPETRDEMMEDPVPIVHEDWKRERLTKKISRELWR